MCCAIKFQTRKEDKNDVPGLFDVSLQGPTTAQNFSSQAAREKCQIPMLTRFLLRLKQDKPMLNVERSSIDVKLPYLVLWRMQSSRNARSSESSGGPKDKIVTHSGSAAKCLLVAKEQTTLRENEKVRCGEVLRLQDSTSQTAQTKDSLKTIFRTGDSFMWPCSNTNTTPGC